jgi:hypothetical protein
MASKAKQQQSKPCLVCKNRKAKPGNRGTCEPCGRHLRTLIDNGEATEEQLVALKQMLPRQKTGRPLRMDVRSKLAKVK